MANENKHFDECRLCLESTESEISLFTKNVVDMVESLTSIKVLVNCTYYLLFTLSGLLLDIKKRQATIKML